jgi:hypothetical protein
MSRSGRSGGWVRRVTPAFKGIIGAIASIRIIGTLKKVIGIIGLIGVMEA